MAQSKNRARRVKTVKYLPQPLNVHEFNVLTDILFETLKENHLACARACGVNYKTWKRWEHTPPEFPWWNFIIRQILKDLIPMLDQRGITKAHRHKLIKALSQLPRNDELLTMVEEGAEDGRGAKSHLLKLLRKGGLYWDQIRLTANRGGYSIKALKHAGDILEVKKTVKGFGEHKRSFWELPDED